MPVPLFSNISAKPMVSHNFVVFVGVTPISFSKASSIEVSIETEALVEGGENRYVHSLSKPASAEKTLTFERGADSGQGESVPMSTANVDLRVGSVFKFIVILVLDQWGLPKKMYVATHVILKKRRFSDLNAMSGEVFVESLEFIYRDLTEVPDADGLFNSAEARKDYATHSSVPRKRFTAPLNPPPKPKPKPKPFK